MHVWVGVECWVEVVVVLVEFRVDIGVVRGFVGGCCVEVELALVLDVAFFVLAVAASISSAGWVIVRDFSSLVGVLALAFVGDHASEKGGHEGDNSEVRCQYVCYFRRS